MQDCAAQVRGQKSGGRSGNDEARMVRAGLALNDEGMTQAGNDELMLMLVLVLGQRAEGEHDYKATDN